MSLNSAEDQENGALGGRPLSVLALRGAGCLCAIATLVVLAVGSPSGAPARYGTALALSIAGAGLVAVGRWRGLSIGCGAVTMLAGLGGLLRTGLWSGSMLAGPASGPESVLHGTASATILTGLAIVLLNTKRGPGTFAAILGVGIAALGLAGLLTSLGPVGAEPRDASELAAGAAFLSIAVGLILSSRRALRRHAVPVLLASGIAIATLSHWHGMEETEKAHLRRTTELMAARARSRIGSAMESRTLALVRMARRWELRGTPSREEWESDASLYVAHYTGYYALSWVDPALQVRWLVPRQRSQAAFSPAESERIRAALEAARDSRNAVGSRPVELPQAGKTIVVCVPIYRDEALGGWIAGVFQLRALLDSVLVNTDVEDYEVTVSDGRERIYERPAGSGVDSRNWSSTLSIDLGGTAWIVSLAPGREAIRHERSGMPITALVSGLLLAALSSLSVYFAQNAGRRAKEAEAANRELQREIAERTHAQEALARVRDELETRVQERTAELARANEDLKAEIAERKAAEETLRASEERYRELFDNANDLVFIHDLNGNYTSINKAAQQITGYTRQEASSMNLAQLVAPESLDLVSAMVASHLGGQASATFEVAILTKDGRRLLLEINTRLVYRSGNPVAVQGIARDVTERRRLEEQLRQSQKMEAVGRLAGGIAHDFNNLLTVIGAYGQMILEDLPPSERERLHGYAQEILWAAERASGLTNRLLAFSRRQVVQPKILDLNELVSAMDNMLRRLIGEDIEFETVLAPHLGAIKADPAQMEQVVMNLAINARDAMQTGGRLTLETANAEFGPDAGAPGALPPGHYVMLAVSDTGVGMDAEVRAHLFEPFFTTKDTGKGTGLGLSTVYGVVKQGGGDIIVESEPGKGSRFTIYLPRVEAAGSPEPPAPEAAQSGARGERETVLLVEDEYGVRKLVRKMLLQHAYRVLEAGDGQEALSLCEQHPGPIDILLTDIVMPKMSGRELAENLCARYPAMKVLYMTGYTEDAIVRHGLSEESLAVLKKPFLADALARKLRELVER